MLRDRRWLYRPWIPFLKAVEAGALSGYALLGPVLDLACGDGVFAASAYDAHIDVGLDLHMESLRSARGKYGILTRADATAMPFGDGSFATVLSVCAIEHIPDIEGVLKEVARVLKPGGELIFSVPSVTFGDMLLKTRLLRMLGLNTAADEHVLKKNAKSTHFNVYTLKRWEELLGGAGLKVRRHELCLSATTMLIWSFMTSFVFKFFMLPFRIVREYNIRVVDNILRGLLKGLFGGILRREMAKRPEAGGYLIVAARRDGEKR
jgi:SAM-dependent methyltransferase